MTLSKSYTTLRTAIQTALSEGHLRAQKAVEHERVVTYWTVGDHLVKFLDANPADYGSQVMKLLSKDLDLRSRLLYEIVKFRRATPKVPSKALLSWSHYRTVLAMPDIGEQGRLLAEAERQRWTVAELAKEIAASSAAKALEDRGEQGKIKSKALAPLQAKRGEPHLYKLIEKPNVGLVLDQGFRTYTIPPRSVPADARPGNVFRAVRAGKGYRLVPYEKVRRVWSYAAHVNRVIDGDTMWVTLDTGFGDYVDQKLRLRGIDTPEMGTAEGQRARDFVNQAVGNANPIVVATTKVDKYDRYLADVLYSREGTTDVSEIVTNGIYLNRELIAEGLAERYV